MERIGREDLGRGEESALPQRVKHLPEVEERLERRRLQPRLHRRSFRRPYGTATSSPSPSSSSYLCVWCARSAGSVGHVVEGGG